MVDQSVCCTLKRDNSTHTAPGLPICPPMSHVLLADLGYRLPLAQRVWQASRDILASWQQPGIAKRARTRPLILLTQATGDWTTGFAVDCLTWRVSDLALLPPLSMSTLCTLHSALCPTALLPNLLQPPFPAPLREYALLTYGSALLA